MDDYSDFDGKVSATDPTIEGEVPCASPPVDKDNKRSDWIKIICDLTTTLMKIPTTLDEDSNGSSSATIMDIFLMSPDSIHLERPTKAEFATMWDAVKKMHKPLVTKAVQRPTIN